MTLAGSPMVSLDMAPPRSYVGQHRFLCPGQYGVSPPTPHAHIHTLSPGVLLCDLCQYRDLAHCLWLHPQSAVKIPQPQSCVCSCTSCTFFKHAMLPTRRRGTLFPARRLFTIWCPFHMHFTFISCQSAAYSSHVLAVLTRVLLSFHAP